MRQKDAMDPLPSWINAQDPQRPPGVPQAGKNFAPRPELIAPGYRGGGLVTIGPGSEQFRRGSADVEAKKNYTLRDVMGSRRKPK